MAPLSYNEAYTIIGGLSGPSKMPWYGWSTSAFDCQTGTKLREVEGSTCSSCYACKGNYRFKNVKIAHERRLKALDEPRFVEAFIVVLEKLYRTGLKTYTLNGVKVKENRFRWHDSGDIQSVAHLKMIVDIAVATPYIDHWLPTREYGYVKDYIKQFGDFPPNLTVRMSAVMVGEGFKSRPMGLPFSTVGLENKTVEQCKAYDQGGKCLDCRACWDQTADINYPKH